MNRRLAIQFNIFIINQTTEENITDLFYLQSCRCHIRSTHMWIGKKMGNRTTMKVWVKCTLKLTLFFSIKIKKKASTPFLTSAQALKGRQIYFIASASHLCQWPLLVFSSLNESRQCAHTHWRQPAALTLPHLEAISYSLHGITRRSTRDKWIS